MDIATAVRFVEDLPFLQVVKSEGVLTPLGAALIVVGLLSLVPVVIGLVVSALASLVSLVSSGPDVRKYGEWAIVTGATDGIGEQLAIELAARGVKVCIVGRSAEKLDATATKIKDKRPAAEVRTIRADFSDTEGGKLYTRIEAELHDILPSVGILFNNVGVSYPSALYFEEFCNPDLAKSTTAPEDMIAVNVTSAVKMTGLVLPHMKKRHKGAIVFVSSAHGRIPAGAPLYAEYGACKNFVQSFARTLAVECEVRFHEGGQWLDRFITDLGDHVGCVVRDPAYPCRCSSHTLWQPRWPRFALPPCSHRPHPHLPNPCSPRWDPV